MYTNEIQLNNYCDTCNEKAVWYYGPRTEQYCDDCVPRGCSCNLEPVDGDHHNLDSDNWKEEVDDQGRLFPCCEYIYYTE